LAVGLSPDPLRELTVLPRPSRWDPRGRYAYGRADRDKEMGWDKKGRGRGNGEGRGREEREGHCARILGDRTAPVEKIATRCIAT